VLKCVALFIVTLIAARFLHLCACFSYSNSSVHASTLHPLLAVAVGLPDVFCKNTGLFVNSDKSLTIEKILEIRCRPSCCSY